jgi:hypothetical protein
MDYICDKNFFINRSVKWIFNNTHNSRSFFQWYCVIDKHFFNAKKLYFLCFRCFTQACSLFGFFNFVTCLEHPLHSESLEIRTVIFMLMTKSIFSQMSAILFTFFHSVLTNLVGIFKIFHSLESFQKKYYEVFKTQLSSFLKGG